MFEVVRFIDKLGIKDDIFQAQKGEEDLERIGFDVIMQIIEKATTSQAEKELYSVLSGPFEMKAKDIEVMDITEFVNAITTCFNLSTLVNFMQRVGPLVQ